MNLIQHKKGIGLPFVLGIVAFVLATVSTLLTYAVFQARLVDRNIEQMEAYANAVQSVDATLKIIVRDQNLDALYLTDLENYMGVTIELYSANVYMITSMVTENNSIVSYITGSAASTTTTELLFDYTGTEETFTLSPLVTPTTLLAAYLPLFIETQFPLLPPVEGLTSFDSIVDYIYQLTTTPGSYTYQLPTILTNQGNPTVSGHWYIDGNVEIPKNKFLTVPEGYLLFINGNLTMNENSVLIGNIVINGNLIINGKGKSVEEIKGTFYVDGNVTTSKSILLGTLERPTFIFAEGDVSLGNSVTGYAYFLCDNFSGQQGNVSITGGVYYTVSASIPSSGIAENPNLDINLFYDYAIPIAIEVESDPEGGGETTTFKYTFPKLS